MRGVRSCVNPEVGLAILRETQREPDRHDRHDAVDDEPGDDDGELRGVGTAWARNRTARAVRGRAASTIQSASCLSSAFDRSFAVMSTIGITRSYAMRVGPMTPSVPITWPSTS